MTTVAVLQRGFVSPKLAPAVRVRNRGARKADRWPSSRFTMSNSAVLFVPAVHLCARVLAFPSRPPQREGWAERRQAHYFCCRVCETRRSTLVRRGASHDAGRSPLGATPWRFSAGGRASISGIASGYVQRAPRSQVVMPGGRCPGPPEPAVTSRGRRTPLPAPPSGSSLEDAPP